MSHRSDSMEKLRNRGGKRDGFCCGHLRPGFVKALKKIKANVNHKSAVHISQRFITTKNTTF